MLKSQQSSALFCQSCGRQSGKGPEDVTPFLYIEISWCPICANILRVPNYPPCVDQPSPGRMCEHPMHNPLDAFYDCFTLKPKNRILMKDACYEIQRAWTLWYGDKTANVAMFMFYGWLNQYRPYFLTFRNKSDPWQYVHCWLNQFERGEGLYSPKSVIDAVNVV